MKKTNLIVVLAFLCLSPLFAQRAPIDVNLIIDCSTALTSVKEEVTAWVISRLDQILAEGDRITVWSAGTKANVVYSGRINSDSDKEAVRRNIRELTSASGGADFAGALLEASQRQSSGFSYTLLISAAPEALSSILSGPQSSLLRFSRVEEFSGWRALVVGLNLDTRVRRAASAFLGN